MLTHPLHSPLCLAPFHPTQQHEREAWAISQIRKLRLQEVKWLSQRHSGLRADLGPQSQTHRRQGAFSATDTRSRKELGFFPPEDTRSLVSCCVGQSLPPLASASPSIKWGASSYLQEHITYSSAQLSSSNSSTCACVTWGQLLTLSVPQSPYFVKWGWGQSLSTS